MTASVQPCPWNQTLIHMENYPYGTGRSAIGTEDVDQSRQGGRLGLVRSGLQGFRTVKPAEHLRV